MHFRIRLLAGFAGTVALVAACEPSTSLSKNLHFAGFLSGAKVRPVAVASSANGQAVVIVSQGLELSYDVTWAGLTGAPTGVHIHGPADAEQTADVLVDFSDLPPGSTNHQATMEPAGGASGSMNVTPGTLVTPTVSGDSLMKLLSAGLLYVEVHTAANPDGEIRTQLKKQ